MVFNTTRYAKFPFSASSMTAHTKKMTGKGMGSVLLSTGGGGAASSYMDMDDYIRTTGINPYTRGTSGSGMKGLHSKLSRLNIEKPSRPKMKNITMSF